MGEFPQRIFHSVENFSVLTLYCVSYTVVVHKYSNEHQEQLHYATVEVSTTCFYLYVLIKQFRI